MNPSSNPPGPDNPGLRPRSGLPQGLLGLPTQLQKKSKKPQPLHWILFLALHAPLVMVMKASALVATAHALTTFAVGLQSLRARAPERIVYVMGYIIASEPLWRVSRALIFHESAKYALAGLSILSLIRWRLFARADKSALLYFILLLPSILMLETWDRRPISFNLSGPFALAMCALFFSALRLNRAVLQRLFLTTLAPILGLAFVATFSTLTTEEIDFYRSKVAAGGLGNNQASSILGLGALMAFFFVCTTQRPRYLRWFVAGVGLWCGAQGALTFSRGGVATALGAIAVASFFLLRDRRSRAAVVFRVAAIAVIAVYVAIPFLNIVTTGDFSQRYTDTQLTGRDKIIEADLMAFRENPLFGVGPGGSKEYHARTFSRASTHTEYSRLLAEHGLLGLTSLLLLAWMAAQRLFAATTPVGKALAAGLTVWTLLFMFHAAMRMAAASFIFALGAAHLMSEAYPALRQRRRAQAPAAPISPSPARAVARRP